MENMRKTKLLPRKRKILCKSCKNREAVCSIRLCMPCLSIKFDEPRKRRMKEITKLLNEVKLMLESQMKDIDSNPFMPERPTLLTGIEGTKYWLRLKVVENTRRLIQQIYKRYEPNL